MAVTKYFNADEAAAEQKETEARLEEEMEIAFKSVERTQEMYDVVFSLMEIRI